MFSTLMARHYEPAGQPITRITNQLGDLNSIIWKELGIGVRTPEGVWDWMGRKRRELGCLGRDLANREIFDFTGANIVKNHKLNNVIVQHWMSIDSINKVDCVEAEVSLWGFSLFLSKIGEFLDTETPGKQFGPSDVYDATKQIGEI